MKDTFSEYRPSSLGIKGVDRRSLRLPQALSGPGFTEFTVDLRHGASTIALRFQADHQELDIFPSSEPLGKKLPYEIWNAPLFPIANRLRGKGPKAWVSSVVRGVPIQLPRNHQGAPDREAVHLHGHLHSVSVDQVKMEEGSKGVRLESIFHHPLGTWWSGSAEVRITQSLSHREFRYEISARNTGETAIPVGFGSHPWFLVDSPEFELRVPASRVAEVTDLVDVFPTGKFLSVDENPTLDFRSLRRVNPMQLDYFWLDLELDETGAPFAEIFNPRKSIRYRMTGLTKDIRGIQVYYPGQENRLALEMVTHLPDPRDELWGTLETGMQLLQPGETVQYGWKLEVFSTTPTA